MTYNFSVRVLLLVVISFSGLLYAEKDKSILVVGPEVFNQYWVPKKNIAPNFNAAKRSKGGCVSLGLVVESDGKTSAVSVVGSFPDDALNEVLVESLQKTRYKPAESNPDRIPVYTVITTGMYYFFPRKTDKEAEVQAKVQKVCERLTDKWLMQLVEGRIEQEPSEDVVETQN